MLAETLKAVLPPPLLRPLQWAWWRVHIAKDWWGTKVWTQTREVVTPLGFKLTSGFHPAYAQMRAGTFEPGETAALARLFETADVFLDVGANLGYYGLLALQGGLHVLAFEPQPQNLQALYANLKANDRADGAEVFPVALSDKPGLLTLYGASGPSASLVKDWAGYSPKYNQVVPVSTLDLILGERFAGKRLVVKIDVEGAELGVLKGALATLSRNPKPSWLVEICLDEFHPAGANPDFLAIFELFWSHGYQASTAAADPVLLPQERVREWAAEGRSDAGTFNYLFAA